VVGDVGLVDALMVVALAYEVDDGLRDEREQDDRAEGRQHEDAEEEPGPATDAVRRPADDPGAEGDLDDGEDDVEGDEYDGGGGELAADEVPALAHGGEALVVLEHGDDAGEVPDDADVDEPDEVGEDEEEGEEREEAGAVVGGDEERDDEDDEGDVVGEEEEEGGEEGGGEPAPYAGHDGEDLGEGEGVVLGGVEGGDGEDGRGGGEEGEEEEGEEVGGLEEEEGRPVGGEAVEEAAVRVGAGRGGVERGVVRVDGGEEGVGDGDVEEEERGEREDEGGGDAGEKGAVRAAEDVGGGAVHAGHAQELKLLGLAIHRDLPLSPPPGVGLVGGLDWIEFNCLSLLFSSLLFFGWGGRRRRRRKRRRFF
jgi:hypothetical protein